MAQAEKKDSVQTWEKIVAFIFGVVFVIVMLSIAFFIPNPTEYQFFIFRIVLALAASGIGSVVPGFLHVEWKPKSKYMPYIRAGGAIALFVIVYNVNPPALLQPENPVSIHQGKVEAKSIENVNQNFGIPVDEFRKLAVELGVTKHALEEYSKKVDVTGSALKNFFKILEKQNVPPEDLNNTLRQIAERYKNLQKKLEFSVFVENPEIKSLKEMAKEALNAGDFDETENLLSEAIDKGVQCAENMKEAANDCLISTAELKAELGDLKNIQLEYKAAAEYYRKAVDLLPEDSETLRAEYLNSSETAFRQANLHKEAQEALERALEIRRKPFEPKHPDVAQSQNSPALPYRIQDRYNIAVSADECLPDSKPKSAEEALKTLDLPLKGPVVASPVCAWGWNFKWPEGNLYKLTLPPCACVDYDHRSSGISGESWKEQRGPGWTRALIGPNGGNLNTPSGATVYWSECVRK